jgi:hypothetical protein
MVGMGPSVFVEEILMSDAMVLCDDNFVTWMYQHRNQRLFASVQEAYKAWLNAEGFLAVGEDYTIAVQIVLVYLTHCVVDPEYRKILVNSDDEPDRWAEVPLEVTDWDEDSRTPWEFLTESNFRQLYQIWQRERVSQSS